MKRTMTYYFLLLECLNVLFVLWLSPMVGKYGYDIKETFGAALPLATKWVIQYPWWPWGGAAICAVGVVLSLWGILKDNVLRYLLVIILFVEIGLMFFTATAFIMMRF